MELARAELAGFAATWDWSDPVLVREGLLEVVPLLVSEYGDLAATAAAEWYEEVRGRDVGGQFFARLGPGADRAAVEGSVRWAAGELFGDDPERVLQLLDEAMQRYIAYSGRSTVARNVRLDPSKPRFARVPQGSHTCAFCLMLASRGFVYHTEATAGETEDFHNDCNCAIVASWDREAAHIEGYDPDKWFAMYLEAREATGSSDPRVILAELRRRFPDAVTDGVFDN